MLHLSVLEPSARDFFRLSGTKTALLKQSQICVQIRMFISCPFIYSFVNKVGQVAYSWSCSEACYSCGCGVAVSMLSFASCDNRFLCYLMSVWLTTAILR